MTHYALRLIGSLGFVASIWFGSAGEHAAAQEAGELLVGVQQFYADGEGSLRTSAWFHASQPLSFGLSTRTWRDYRVVEVGGRWSFGLPLHATSTVLWQDHHGVERWGATFGAGFRIPVLRERGVGTIDLGWQSLWGRNDEAGGKHGARLSMGLFLLVLRGR